MNERRNKLAKNMRIIFSACMTLLFFSLWTIQAVHSHNFSAANSSEEEYVYAADKCKICDYLVHKESQKFLVPPSTVLTIPLNKPVTLLCGSYVGTYEFTLQGFTNKGPPSSLA